MLSAGGSDGLIDPPSGNCLSTFSVNRRQSSPNLLKIEQPTHRHLCLRRELPQLALVGLKFNLSTGSEATQVKPS